MDYNLDEKFLQDLTSTFDAAVASKAVVYNGSGTSKVVQREMNGTTVNFQITELTNLTHRPDNMSGKPSNNPFENPEPELTVRPTYFCSLPRSMNLKTVLCLQFSSLTRSVYSYT